MSNTSIQKHYEGFWENKSRLVSSLNLLDQSVQILEFAPNAKRGFWTYATAGMSCFPEKALELHIFSLEKDENISILLNAIADFHFSLPKGLGLGHTVNFGQPWKPGSNCEYGLISLPYLDGPELEECENVKFLWLIPITHTEREFKKKNGLEALEHLLEINKFNYLDPNRASVVNLQ